MLFSEITPTRNFNLLYIILDSIFILVLIGLLIAKKKYMTTLWALFGGVLYFIVDYGYFYLISHSREIYFNGELQGNLKTALILFWMSMSYGITNFAFIWLCLKKRIRKKSFYSSNYFRRTITSPCWNVNLTTCDPRLLQIHKMLML